MGPVPVGAAPIVGNPLDPESLGSALRLGDTVVHLVGTPHSSPSKAQEFLSVDLASARAIADAGLTATGLRPWYVLGPGHRWPLLFVPGDLLAGHVPSLRAGARRLGRDLRAVDVPAIRACSMRKGQVP